MPEKQAPRLYPHDHLMKAVILPFIPELIQPNHMTVLRFLLTPIVLWLLVAEAYVWAVPLFVFTAFTDVIDGSLARVRDRITTWGIFFDPIADKLLVGSVMLLISLQYYHAWLVFLALFLDMIPGLRWAFSKNQSGGVIMSANAWGKTKMVLQCVSIGFLLLGITLQLPVFIAAGEYTFGLATVFAVIAVITYSL
jgi:CDP-diacylglycerol--glycerol-3-phosphate 3-phosphatidyltransferase